MKRKVSIKAFIVMVLASFLLSISTPALALKSNANGYTVTDSRDYPIIFIPGMAGSTLDIGGSTTTNAWPGSLSTNDEAFKVLALKADGQTPLYGQRVVATGTVRYGAGDVYIIAGDWQVAPIYQPFYDYMQQQGYSYNSSPNGKVFFDFPYDFRQDNTRWTQLLDKKIDDVLKQTKADKVILVGHSMGGIQARLYMKDPNRAKKVAAVVFMGTPQHGSPMPFFAMTEGYNFGNAKLSDTRMWEISGNWAAGYQLLPDFPFLFLEPDQNNLSGSIQQIPQLHDISWINTSDWISTQEAQHVLASGNVNPSTINYGLPNQKFATDSVNFHKMLGDSVDKYPWVKYYAIMGTGQPTVTAFGVSLEENPRLPKPILQLTKVISNLGDGTVPLSGAQINGLDGQFEVVAEHGSIPSNPDAQSILTNIRKQVNNEDMRNGLAANMTAFAKENIVKAQPVAAPADIGSGDTMIDLARDVVLSFISGTPDPEKIKLRDEIRNMASKLAENARANITIATGVEKNSDGAEMPEHLYIDVKNWEVQDTGTGVVSGATMNVNVDSLTTFEQAIASTDGLEQAWMSGKITVQGNGGLIDVLKGKIAKWISKYYKVAPSVDSNM